MNSDVKEGLIAWGVINNKIVEIQESIAIIQQHQHQIQQLFLRLDEDGKN